MFSRYNLKNGARREDGSDVSNKRSDDMLAIVKAETVIQNIDMMVDYLLGAYGLEFVCEQEEWRDLLEVRSLLSSFLNGSEKPVCSSF